MLALDQDSLTSSSNSLKKETAVVENLNGNSSKRAQWDKTQHEIDLMYFNISKLKLAEQRSKAAQQSPVVVVKKTVNPSNVPVPQSPAMPNKIQKPVIISTNTAINTVPNSITATPTNKRAKNLNLAKEQLYEMKKSIDAKINLNNLNNRPQSSVPPSPRPSIDLVKPLTLPKPAITTATPTVGQRTTPRKVKKRSGERSMTIGIVNDIENEGHVSRNQSPHPRHSSSRHSSVSSVSARTPQPPTSSSLHNIANCLRDETSRPRRDSYASTTSSGTCTLSSVAYSMPGNEYKENKAYELRKKSNLMNKIQVKSHQTDPIYTRSHPVCAEIIDQQISSLHQNGVNIGSYEQSAAARKRLFVKKNEKNFDPNTSIGSNGSSASSNLISASNSMNFMKNFKQSNAIKSGQAQTNSNITTRRSKSTAPVINKPPSRSKSNNDLYYNFERTNSAQDLIELLNNCDAPAGDLNQYRIMLNECEKLQFHVNKLKTQQKNKKTATQQSQQKVTQIDLKPQKNEVNERDEGLKSVRESVQHVPDLDLNQNRHRRTNSLPSYIAIPTIKIEDYDLDQDVLKNMQ